MNVLRELIDEGNRIIREKARKYGEENKEKIKENGKQYYEKNREKKIEHSKEDWKKLRKIVLDHYGRVCVCCGEDIEEFLSIDHVNNDGAEHRKKVGAGPTFYRWLIKNNFPDDFQVLCRNCNWGKRVNNGICPHKNKVKVSEE